MGLFFIVQYLSKMNQNIDTKIESKIESKIGEDLSPTRNLTGLHLKIVGVIAIIWS